MAMPDLHTRELPNEFSGREHFHEFRIGLSMSGAISAGAYTAAVFDF